MSSTATMMLRQLVMFIIDKIFEEDRQILLASKLELITLPDGMTQLLGPAVCDMSTIFKDVCLSRNSMPIDELLNQIAPHPYCPYKLGHYQSAHA